VRTVFGLTVWAQRRQGLGQLDRAFGNPEQRPHRIPQRDRLDQTAQILQQRRVLGAQRTPPAPRLANLPGRQRRPVQILPASLNRAAGQPGGPGYRRHSAMPNGPNLRGRKQAPPAFIQLIAQRGIPLPNSVLINHETEYGNPLPRENPSRQQD
jgi:hypothetical protein